MLEIRKMTKEQSDAFVERLQEIQRRRIEEWGEDWVQNLKIEPLRENRFCPHLIFENGEK